MHQVDDRDWIASRADEVSGDGPGAVMTDTALVIDDDADTRRLLAAALREAGFVVEQAPSGQAGRQRLAEGGIAVVLLDYRLQGEDGVTCLQAIVRRHPGLPVVMMTGHGSEDVAVEAMKSGAVDYVVKQGQWLGTACRRATAVARARPQRGTEEAGSCHVGPPGTAEAVLAAELRRWEDSGFDSGRHAAVRAAVEAAREASARAQHGEAARHLAAGLDALGATGASRDRLWVTLATAQAEALRRVGAERDARSRATAAVEPARRLGDPEVLARAALAVAGRQQGFGAATPDDAVVGVLREALHALPVADGALRALTMARLAEELAVTGPTNDRWSLGRDAMRMARRLGDPAVIAAVIHTAHWALWQPEESDDRLALANEAIALAERLGDRATLLEGWLLRFWCLLDAGDFPAAEGELETANRLVAATRQPYYVWLVTMGRAALAFASAPVPEVEAFAAEALGAGHQAQNPNAALFFAAQMGSLCWLAGRDAGVDASLEDIVDYSPILAPTVQCARAITSAEAGRLEEARGILRALLDDGSWRTIRNISWLPAMSFLAEACATLHDESGAAELYEVLRPFDGRIVTLPPLMLYGPVSHYLGRLAATLGDWERAARHFDAALDLAGRAQARRWLARTQVAYATMLLERRAREDILLARGLLSAAARTAADLAMEGLARRVQLLQATGRGEQWGATPAGAAATPPEAGAAAALRCEGDFWSLEFEGRRALVRDARGLHYLRTLLERPGEMLPALDLVATVDAGHGDAPPAQEGIPTGADGQALADYRRRLRELPGEIAEAERRADLGLVEQLRGESEIVQDAIESSLGLGGRIRLSGDTVERARSRVWKAINAVYARLRETLPGLVHHLETHVKTGTLVVYRPDPARPVVWRTR